MISLLHNTGLNPATWIRMNRGDNVWMGCLLVSTKIVPLSRRASVTVEANNEAMNQMAARLQRITSRANSSETEDTRPYEEKQTGRGGRRQENQKGQEQKNNVNSEGSY
ncbi:hypothetical protein INR49_003327 [Caranx melampygus]|nr:hypothetical protein INR49_003327 [Caranx melampygus]